jgi:signal transduction histidine kinase
MLQERWQGLSAKKVHEGLKKMEETAGKAGVIVDGLLLLAQVRKVDLVLEDLFMPAIMMEVQARLWHEIQEKGATVILPQEWLPARGHTIWVEEIWVNYVTNALKYGGTPPQVTLGSTQVSDNMVEFWVKDNGPGLSLEQQEKLFIPFSQVGQKITGHGLGLSIVLRIVEKLGGEVGVDSQEGMGSRFWFTLPAA